MYDNITRAQFLAGIISEQRKLTEAGYAHDGIIWRVYFVNDDGSRKTVTNSSVRAVAEDELEIYARKWNMPLNKFIMTRQDEGDDEERIVNDRFYIDMRNYDENGFIKESVNIGRMMHLAGIITEAVDPNDFKTGDIFHGSERTIADDPEVMKLKDLRPDVIFESEITNLSFRDFNNDDIAALLNIVKNPKWVDEVFANPHLVKEHEAFRKLEDLGMVVDGDPPKLTAKGQKLYDIAMKVGFN